MIVCSCNVVTDKQIRRAARDGASDLGDVARDCRAGAGCGGCRVTIEEILDEVHGESQAHVEPPLFTSVQTLLNPS